MVAGALHTLEACEPLIKRQSTFGSHFDEGLRSVLTEIKRFKSLRCKIKSAVREEDAIYLALLERNMPISPVSTPEMRRSFRSFLLTFDPTNMTPTKIATAEGLLRRWEVIVVQHRHLSLEPAIIWSALHFLTVLVSLLLPTPLQYVVADGDTVSLGTEYVLDGCYSFMKSLVESSKYTKEALKEVVIMMLQLLSRWGQHERHRICAQKMLDELLNTDRITQLGCTQLPFDENYCESSLSIPAASEHSVADDSIQAPARQSQITPTEGINKHGRRIEVQHECQGLSS